ncbi:MAG: hypothetical protein DSY85_11670 [Marinomonas sp.]|nr:MAG: hypothetical protein DSY85_11670 [Marinomonas sp.]
MSSTWLTKAVLQFERVLWLVSIGMLFVLGYFWGVLEFGMSHPVSLMTSLEALSGFEFSGRSVHQLPGGIWAHISEGEVGYIFTRTELLFISIVTFFCQIALAIIMVLSLIALRDKSYRLYAGVALYASGLLMVSPLYSLYESGVVLPWWELVRVAGALLCVRWAAKSLPVPQTHSQALIVYASQTGSAKYLAQRLHDTAHALMDIACVSTLTEQILKRYQRVFFVVSTYGQGEAPDSARRFVNTLQGANSAASQTQFSVLALGDRTYQTFCAFGHYLSELLEQKGYQRAIPTTEIDRMDPQGVAHWWQQVGELLGIHTAPELFEYDDYTVVANECLNPEQTHRLAHRVTLFCANARYEAGDLLAVQPEQKDEHERLYSIASYQDNTIELLVRQHIRADGTIGLASGMLSQLTPGDRVLASVREHTTFHPKANVPWIMIGAGTGLAPFISFLKKRQAEQDSAPCWLFFGEQYVEHDAYFAKDLTAFQDQGILTRLDRAWSLSDGVYVPDLLQQSHKAIRQWVAEQGAHVYVCGSREGFGESVLATLQDILPEPQWQSQLHTDLY